MTYFNRINVSESIDVIIQVHLNSVLFVAIGIFMIKSSRFQSAVCNSCHDALLMSIEMISIAILSFHGVHYSCIIAGIIKSEVISLLRNADSSEKIDSL